MYINQARRRFAGCMDPARKCIWWCGYRVSSFKHATVYIWDERVGELAVCNRENRRLEHFTVAGSIRL